MNRAVRAARRGRWAAGASATALVALAALPALAVLHAGPVQAAAGKWEVLRWSVSPGAAVAGQEWTITGVISAPFPTDVITDLELRLTRVPETSACPSYVEVFHVRDGDGMGDDGGPATSSTTSTTDPSTTTTRAPTRGLDQYRFRFTVVPRCNGYYQVSIIGTADRPGPVPSSVSDPLPMGDPTDPDNAVKVGLRSPDVTDVTAAVGADRSVAVSWTPPVGYATSPPPDFAGYGVDYSYDDGATWHDAAFTEPTAAAASFRLRGGDPAGDYLVRVRGVRANADGTLDPAIVASGGSTAVTTTAVGAAPTTPTSSGPSRGGGGGGRSNSGRGVPPRGTAVPQEQDDGYNPYLDYDREEGDEHAVLPDDASSFLDFVPDSPGAAILVPYAIAQCLAVWAFHLRLLARRLDTPTVTPMPTITVDTTRPGRTPTA